MKLHTLKPAKGSVRKVKRIGRGPGSGNGTTAGKGYKGQQARSGYQSSFKEGGQMPMYRRLPKFGFKNVLREEYKIINLDSISEYLKKGILKQDISIADMVSKRIIGGRNKVKLLGRGEGVKVNIEVNSISAMAKEKIEKSGGKVTVIE